ncbi:MAG: CPBP family intramembrane metalloprotease [Polyangiaceae bacterium]|nr:CPBP family intramembrane metalloprotease [Polyangiaceae bacterium]
MAHHPSLARSTRPRASVEVGLLAAGLALALALTWGSAAAAKGGSWAQLTLPSLALIAAAVGWFRLRVNPLAEGAQNGWRSILTGGAGPRWSWVGVSLVCLLLLLFVAAGFLWPAARTLGTPPSAVELGALVVLVPIAEEVFFRGALLQSLRRRLGAVGSTLVVSSLFGLLHQRQGQLSTMLVASLVLCAITLSTRTLVWAILLHGTWNALTLVVRMPPTVQRFMVAGGVTIVVLGLVGLQILPASRNKS